MNTEWVRTEQLQVGDTIEVWWRPFRDTIVALRPYEGSLRRLGLVQIASFALNQHGMTLEAGACYKRIVAEQRQGSLFNVA